MVRIFLHIVRKSDGTGGLTPQEINTALDILANDFAPHNICFYLLGIDEINNDNFYNSLDPGEYDQLVKINAHNNAVDIYLLGNNTIWETSSGGGRAVGVPGKALAVGGNGLDYNAPSVNFPTSHVLSHEMGHCLGLHHTHHGSQEGNCNEFVNGSNCGVCGDFVCDTPADPDLRFKVSPPPNCQWLDSKLDPKGDPYVPDEHIIMSYTIPTCMEYLTPGQGIRMRAILQIDTSMQKVIVPENLVLNNLLIFPGDTILYDAVDTIKVYNVTVEPTSSLTLRAGKQIVISSNTYIKQGSYFRAYIDTKCVATNPANSVKTKKPNKNNILTAKNNIIIPQSFKPIHFY